MPDYMVHKCAKFINLGLGLSGLSHHLEWTCKGLMMFLRERTYNIYKNFKTNIVFVKTRVWEMNC